MTIFLKRAELPMGYNIILLLFSADPEVWSIAFVIPLTGLNLAFRVPVTHTGFRFPFLVIISVFRLIVA